MTPPEPTSNRRERHIRTVLLASIAGILVVAALLTGGPRSARIPDGSEAPDFSLSTTTHHTETLSQHRGQPVFLIFWATWCQICTLDLAALSELAALPETQGMIFRAIAMNSSQDIERLRRRTGIPWEHHLPILLDPDSRVAQSYQVGAVPTSMLINAEGHVVKSFEGSVGRQVFARAIDDLK